MKWSQRFALLYIRTKFKLLSAISKKKAAQSAFSLFSTPQRRTVKKLPPVFTAGERLNLQEGTIHAHGWRWNHPSDKKVLILHGFESSVTQFDRYISPLVKKGYEVLAFDAPAHGRSPGKQITAPLYKDMIRAIHKKYGPVQGYIAHSFGGLAVSLALEEISHTQDYRLVLIAPATETTTAIRSFFRFLNLDEKIRKEFDLLIIKKGGVSPEWYSIKRAMKHIRARVLWVQDTGDETTPAEDVYAVEKENFPNIRFVYTEGLGHRRIYRDNKVTRAIIDFL